MSGRCIKDTHEKGEFLAPRVPQVLAQLDTRLGIFPRKTPSCVQAANGNYYVF